MDPNNDPNKPVIRHERARRLPILWAEYSRPGNDPLKRVKENQDACVVIDSFAGDENSMFIGAWYTSHVL